MQYRTSSQVVEEMDELRASESTLTRLHTSKRTEFSSWRRRNICNIYPSFPTSAHLHTDLFIYLDALLQAAAAGICHFHPSLVFIHALLHLCILHCLAATTSQRN